MKIYNQDMIDEILVSLEQMEYPFPLFKYNKINNKLQIIGRGGSSIVYDVVDVNNPNKHYAMKVIGFDKNYMSSGQFWTTFRIQNILGEESPYIVKAIVARELCVILNENGSIRSVDDASNNVWENDGLMLQFVIMEKLENIISKDRYSNVVFNRKELFEEDNAKLFIEQIGQAIQTAHSRYVLHRDIKLENIFWDSDTGCYKLGDFGIAKLTENHNAETIVYTDGYGAPEIERRLSDCYDATSDIYSFGVTIFLVLNNLKFPGSDGYYCNSVQYSDNYIFPAPENNYTGMASIIQKMCCYNAKNRFSSLDEFFDSFYSTCFSQGNSDNTDCNYEDMSTEINDVEETEIIKSEDNIEDYVEKIYTRSERKEFEKKYEKICGRISISYTIVLSLLLGMCLWGISMKIPLMKDWRFWLFPVLVLIEAVCVRASECQFTFGVATLLFGIYSIMSVGCTFIHIMLIMTLLTGISSLMVVSTSATIIWVALSLFETVPYIGFIQDYNIGWVILTIVVILICKYTVFLVDNEKYEIYGSCTIVFFLYLPYIVLGIGLILLFVDFFKMITLPEFVENMHLIRVGILSIIVLRLFDIITFLQDETEDGQLE